MNLPYRTTLSTFIEIAEIVQIDKRRNVHRRDLRTGGQDVRQNDELGISGPPTGRVHGAPIKADQDAVSYDGPCGVRAE